MAASQACQPLRFILVTLGLWQDVYKRQALSIIRKVYGKEINITQIPLDDKKTFSLLANGDTTGVFQFESSGMKRYLKQLNPSVFEDIIALSLIHI